MSLGQNLKNYRKLSSLHQEQVAATLGIDRSTYSYYETGKTAPSISTLIKLANMFGVELYALLDYKPESVMHGDHVNYYSKYDQTLPVNRLFRDEQDLILIYRQLNENEQNDLRKRAGLLLQKQNEAEE